MKTTVSAFLILGSILTAGLWFYSTVSHTCAEYDRALVECAAQANAGHWEKSIQTLRELKENWEERKPLLAAFTHHNLLDEIQNALTRTEAAANSRDSALFAVEFSTLKEAVMSLSESDRTNAANIF